MTVENQDPAAATGLSVLPAVSYGEKVSLDSITLPEGIYVSPPPHVFGSKKAGDPRLVITHIVNRNFKSYANVQELGPFHKSFSCIIGPNGSGKSNVIDSMLFVFGFRAQKIRSKKVRSEMVEKYKLVLQQPFKKWS